MPDPAHITRVLFDSRTGNPRATDELLEMVYDELRALAGAMLRQDRNRHTLQPTALVHEAWLRMVKHDEARIEDQNHFVSVAVRVIRRVLIDHARQNGAQKRGAGREREDWEAALRLGSGTEDLDLLALDEALDRLEALSPRQRHIVELRYFGGLTIEETARTLGVAPATVKTDWALARAWLRKQIQKGDTGGRR